MRKVLLLVALSALFLAASDTLFFNGTWRIDPNQAQAPKKPFRFEIGKGMYRCLTCDPKEEVKADGQDHPVSPNSGYDTMNVKIVDDKTIEITYKKGGKVASAFHIAVSADGNHAVEQYTGNPPNSTTPVSVKLQVKRVGAAQPGMHAASGSWLMDKIDNMSDNAKDFSYEQTADGLNAKDPTGFSYSAKFDGKDYPVAGASSIDSVVLKRINDLTFEEITKYKGKIKNTSRMTVSQDGKTMTIDWRDSAGFSGRDVADKR